MDYAIVKTGSKQYRVEPGDVIDVEKLPVEEGSSVELPDVLAVTRQGELILGSPRVSNASVIAEVRAQDRDDKIIVFKYKRKVRYRRKKGHRQFYTRLAITSIMLDGEEIAAWSWPSYPAPVRQEEPPEDVLEEVEAAPLSDAEEEELTQPEDTVTEAPEDEAVDQAIEEPAEETLVQAEDTNVEAPQDDVGDGEITQPEDTVMEASENEVVAPAVEESAEEIAVQAEDMIVEARQDDEEATDESRGEGAR